MLVDDCVFALLLMNSQIICSHHSEVLLNQLSETEQREHRDGDKEAVQSHVDNGSHEFFEVESGLEVDADGDSEGKPKSNLDGLVVDEACDSEDGFSCQADDQTDDYDEDR